MSVNSVSISGNLTRDAELRQGQSGTSVLTFSVAVNDRRKNADGEWGDYTNYIDCKLFGKRAEALERKLTKGTKVAVDGKLGWYQWTAQDGSKRSKVDVMVDEIDIMQRAERKEPEYYSDDLPF